MNKLLCLALLGSLTAAAGAQGNDRWRLLKDTSTEVALELNDKTVFCTDRGYGNIQLKVSVPDLDWLAHFNHRVAGEGLPCITGGACSPTNNPALLLDPNARFTRATIRVQLFEHMNIDMQAKTCQTWLEERVYSHIRGHSFNHTRSSDVAPGVFEKCLLLMWSPGAVPGPGPRPF